MKKNYVSPLVEVAQIRLGAVVLAGSPGVTPLPPHPAPAHRGSAIE